MDRDDIYILHKNDREKFIDEFNAYLDNHTEGYLLVLTPLDTFKSEKQGEVYEKEMAKKLAKLLDENPDAVLATPKKLFQFPNRITGVMFRVDSLVKQNFRIKEDYKFNYEAEFLLRVIKNNSYLICQDIEYFQGEPGDGNYKEFDGIYDKDWYIPNLDNFLIPLLKDYKKDGDIPFLVQYYAMYNITCRLEANKNNNNRHILDAEEIDEFQEKLQVALEYIDDDIIMNAHRFPVYKRDYQYSRMLLRIKYGKDIEEYTSDMSKLLLEDYTEEDYHHCQMKDDEHLFITVGGVPIHSSYSLRCNIQFMDYREGCLEIDGSVPDIYDKSLFKYYFKINDKKYEVNFCERYSLTKYFGRSAYKRYPFHVSIPLDQLMQESAGAKLDLEFYIEKDSREYRVSYQFDSHTSRLAAYPKNSYWHFGKYIAVNNISKTSNGYQVFAIPIKKYNWPYMAAKEIGLGAELLFSFQMHRFRFFLLRAAWVVTAPYFKHKNIWMFFDKIYKAGDSSEYLYKYASEQLEKKRSGEIHSETATCYPDKLYYLVDKGASDYKRLISEGYTPLRRGSFLHRLVFLNANMMIVSNSTVFAFNDYYMENSRYIRGIPDFHVVCVQHGLSVQKIALAQQRLRDNTRLYFCASKYEIENLSHPVYDYQGYGALKLTGVPRYDGLVDEDKKQIMISPTWRMQSAKFVSKNEGVERDYNPLFKETDYYQVYNGLINDKKLIAAAKEYGYRIAYVLHPIVSPQAEDFDKNEYVDIIPSVGDMSYEKMFRESSLMVTDYSGIQFDFAYMRKPLVYYHPEELEAHYEEGTFHYDTMAFGEIVKKRDELVELLIDYMKNGCKMKDEYRRRADDFYEYSDHGNCKRIFDEMVEYQRKVLADR